MMNRKSLSFNYNFFWRRYLYPLVSVLVALSICLSTALPSQALDWFPLLLRGVQVLQLSNISDHQEAEIGKQINQELLSGDVRLYRNSEINRYVEQLGRRLAANSDRPNLKYTFQVVDSDSINAFATLGGYVYLHTGLLKAAANEAELASVVAHEIGHIGGKHLIKQMRQKAIDEGLLTAAGLDRSTAVKIGVQLARNLPRSRQMEFDADQRGLKTLTRTGYAQSGMISFMQKLLSSSSQRSVPTFLSTHPATGDRIAALKRAVDNQPSNSNDGLDNNVYQANIRPLLKS
ncbi:MAG: M48 family metalloprotease [Chlorogloeopsis fritschii C42_A2020_084]|uniref:M48 family metallopeptidase n=1 Tax=Chlorogloeopsis fritschii TaxID=1124 RepID=UPI0019FC7537|nr:M48 family metalloprotease [Chlorogloeopsis fritschii]MBF2007828.1 M48 family metalloprotease [Chlorogloeopsis fritschii C42_A2020_084]